MRAPRWFDRALVLLGLVGILAGLGAVVLGTAPLERELVAATFDDEAGVQVVVAYFESSGFSQLLARWGQSFERGVLLAWMGLALLLIGLCVRRVRLGQRMIRGVGALLVPLVLGLLALPLVMSDFEPLLTDLFIALGGEPAFWSIGCSFGLQPCSRVQALHEVWTATIVLACVGTALAVLRAAPSAWRAGEQGQVLSRGWSRAALVLFLAGGAALAYTMPHAADRELAASTCVAERSEYGDWTASGIAGPHAASCVHEPDDTWRIRLQVDGEGWVSLFTYDAVELLVAPEDLAGHIDHLRAHPLAREPDAPELVLELFVDRRALLASLQPIFKVAMAKGVERVVLLGRAQVEGDSALLGPWVRRSLCPLGELRLDTHVSGPFGNFRDLPDHGTRAHAPLRAQP
jgi:hypothetical protein